MKKILIGLAVVAVLVLVGVVMFKRSGGESRAAALAPVDTALFVNIPDVPRTGFRWISTALAQIAAKPEMQAFLELPLKNLKHSAEASEATGALVNLKPGNIFFAATPDARALLGFQFWGNRKDFDNAITRLRAKLPNPTQTAQSESHNGVEILSTQHGDLTLHSAAFGRWGFLSTSADLLKGALDRVSANAPTDSLQSNPRFAKVLARLPVDPELLFFFEPEKAIDSLLEAGRTLGARPIPSQVEELKSAEAVGGALKFDGRLQRDAIYILRASREDTLPQLTREAIALAPKDATAFCEFSLNFAAIPDFVKSLAAEYPSLAPMAIPLAEAAAQTYGPGCAVVANWPDGSLFPEALLAISAKDPATSRDLLAQLAGNARGAARRDFQGTAIYEIPSPTAPLTFAQGEKFLLAGLGAATVERALVPSPATLRDTPDFKDALTAYNTA
ncbi:MAG: hypothetical protein ACKOF3_11025, partial [Spartobacteria bacterium]